MSVKWSVVLDLGREFGVVIVIVGLVIKVGLVLILVVIVGLVIKVGLVLILVVVVGVRRSGETGGGGEGTVVGCLGWKWTEKGSWGALVWNVGCDGCFEVSCIDRIDVVPHVPVVGLGGIVVPVGFDGFLGFVRVLVGLTGGCCSWRWGLEGWGPPHPVWGGDTVDVRM